MLKIAKRFRQQIVTQGFLPFILEFLTKETVKMGALEFRLAAFLKCAPFELEGKSVFRVKMFQSKWKLAVWHVVNWIYQLQTAFLWISFLWKWCTEPLGEELIMHLIYIAPVTMGWVFMTALYMKPRECLMLLNQHGSVVQTAKDAEVETPHWASHYFVIFSVYYFAFGLLGTWLVMAAMFLWQPTSSKHFYAYLPLNWQESYAVFAVALIHELSWTAWCLTSLGTNFCLWCSDVFTMSDILGGLLSQEMTTRGHVKVYRYLQLFCIIFNDYNGSFFVVGFNTMILLTPIVFIYLALTATNLNPFLYMMLPVAAFFSVFLIMFFFPQDSKVGIRSADCVSTLRSRLIKPEGRTRSGERLAAMLSDAQRRMILKKRIRALAPFGIRIWIFGIYTLDTSGEFMDQLFNNILLLLSL